MAKVVVLFPILTVLSLGCAAKLTKPIMVGSPRAYVMKKTVVSEHEEKGVRTCPKTVTAEIVYLPGGQLQEVNFERGFFASNEFTVQLNDSGTLKQVSLNSDPQVDETIEAVATLIEKAAGAAAKLAPAAADVAVSATATCQPSVKAKLAPLECFTFPAPDPKAVACPDSTWWTTD